MKKIILFFVWSITTAVAHAAWWDILDVPPPSDCNQDDEVCVKNAAAQATLKANDDQLNILNETLESQIKRLNNSSDIESKVDIGFIDGAYYIVSTQDSKKPIAFIFDDAIAAQRSGMKEVEDSWVVRCQPTITKGIASAICGAQRDTIIIFKVQNGYWIRLDDKPKSLEYVIAFDKELPEGITFISMENKSAYLIEKMKKARYMQYAYKAKNGKYTGHKIVTKNTAQAIKMLDAMYDAYE